MTAAYGLGENVVQGAVDPDEFYVHKPTLRQGYRAVLRRLLGRKQLTMVYGTDDPTAPTRNLPTPQAQRDRFCITDEEVLRLAADALVIEDHYGARAGHDTPMDTEWAKDGLDGRLYVVQARPETVVSQKKGDILEEYALSGHGPDRGDGPGRRDEDRRRARSRDLRAGGPERLQGG